MYQIATIDNLSGLAYRMTPPAFRAQIFGGTPSAVFERAQRGDCDAALLPVACLDELDGRMEALGAYGIAVAGQVRSVAVYSRLPLQRIVAQDLPIAVTGASQTSRRLLQLLCLREFGREPRYVDAGADAAARLLIGDEAIYETAKSAWPVVTDLGRWWSAQTGLPFVFARWVVRRDLPETDRVVLGRWLYTCTEVARSEAGHARMTGTLRDMPIAAADARDYYRQIHGRLSRRDLAGLELFMQLHRETTPCNCTA